jgi:hypothetical protein
MRTEINLTQAQLEELKRAIQTQQHYYQRRIKELEKARLERDHHMTVKQSNALITRRGRFSRKLAELDGIELQLPTRIDPVKLTGFPVHNSETTPQYDNDFAARV